MTTEVNTQQLIDYIEAATTPEIISLGQHDYLSRKVYLPPVEPTIATLDVATLDGLVDYIANADEIGDSGCFVHIASPTSVSVYGPVCDRSNQRIHYLHANGSIFVGKGFAFGQWMDAESFIIALQTMFASSDDKTTILARVGNLRSEKVQDIEDDGTTQTTNVRSGIARVEGVPLPNPAELRPYRTFANIEQPLSKFVFRMKDAEKEGGKPSFALFEASGGSWQLEAISSIKVYLDQQLTALDSGVSVIA